MEVIHRDKLLQKLNSKTYISQWPQRTCRPLAGKVSFMKLNQNKSCYISFGDHLLSLKRFFTVKAHHIICGQRPWHLNSCREAICCRVSPPQFVVSKDHNYTRSQYMPVALHDQISQVKAHLSADKYTIPVDISCLRVSYSCYFAWFKVVRFMINILFNKKYWL